MDRGEFQQNTIEQSQNNPEIIWQSLSAEVRDNCTKLLEPLVKESEEVLGEIVSDEKRAEWISKVMEVEKVFLTRIIAETERALAARPGEKLITLLDIDETIGVSPATPGPLTTVLRPSLVPLLSHLKNRGVQLGFLTNRGAALRQLSEENQLQPIAEWIDPNLIFSDRSYEYWGDGSIVDLSEKFGGPGGIIDDSKMTDKGGPIRFRQGDYRKIMALADIRTKFPTGAIMVVDDFDYPKVLNNQNGMYGVSLRSPKRNASQGMFFPPEL